jgi:CRISPR-associated protein Cst2
LLHRETTVTAYQYPFALNLEDCRGKVDWTRALLKAIGQLNDVAGNHARSYFEFAPASIVLRLTPQLVAGFDTYGFRIADSGRHELPEIVDGILTGDYPGNELYIGGKVVKDMEDMTCGTEAAGATAGNKGKGTQTLKDALTSKGAILDRSPQRLLERVGADAFAQA